MVEVLQPHSSAEFGFDDRRAAQNPSGEQSLSDLLSSMAWPFTLSVLPAVGCQAGSGSGAGRARATLADGVGGSGLACVLGAAAHTLPPPPTPREAGVCGTMNDATLG